MYCQNRGEECRPPWVVFPELNPQELPGYLRQGVTEAYFSNHWQPFWQSLDESRRKEYLSRWKASAEWRDAIRFHFEEITDCDLAEDARESEEWLARNRATETKWFRKPWWARLFAK